MAGKESDVVLRFKMDGQVQYAKTIKEINQEMNLAATEYKNQVSAMDKDATQTEKLRAAKQKLEKQVELASQRTKQLREEYAQSVAETGRYSTQSEKLYKKLLDSQTGENKLKDALEETNEALKKQGDVSIETAKKLEKIEEAGEKVKGVGEKMSVGITAPLVGIGAVGFKTANDLSTAQGQIRAAFGLTEDEAKNLNQAMEDVFADGMVESIDEAKEAVIKIVNQFPELKKQSSEAIQSMTEKALTLEKTFDSDLDETMRGANALMTAYGFNGEEAMDLITVATQNGLDKTHELGDNLAEYATQFEQSGYSAQEMFTILEAGLDGGAYNLDKVNDLVKEFGIRVSDGTIEGAVEGLGGNFQSLFNEIKNGGLTNKEAFQKLANEITNLGSEQEKATAISAIFGSQGEDSGIQVIEAMSKSADAINKNKEAYENVSGASDKLKEQMKETVTYQSAMNELMLAGSDIGEVFAPYIQKAADAVKAFAQWFQSLDQDSKNWIVTIGVLIATIGPMLVVFGTLMGSITKVAGAIRTLQAVFGAMKLAFAANPFILILGAIAALVAAFVWAYNNVEWFRDGVNAVIGGIKDIVVQYFNYIKGFLGNVFGGILKNFENFYNAGKRIFNGFIDFITGVFTGDWSKAWNGIVDIFGGIFDGISAVAKAPINAMIGLINGFLGGLNNIKIPDWVPGVGGKGFKISTIPYLAKGGHLVNGQAIVGEAGPELLTAKNGKTTVTPLSDDEKRKGIGGKVGSNITLEQHNHFGNVDANNPSELDRMNRKLARAEKELEQALGGIV
ncbi:phage tail tape measure protein [Enterococcus sp. JM4C]|uniref:phage tail tape measure protein n=1 Tax=Candidatus Enterococcus huntleyi TaxID=1857217 RepID=UPI0013795019|nr:phage tail tape measure protein [Enterococcus sp. JM4C]KAF1295188.1 phage tail tape measure protein [Enterococcus sp. JM4C]